MVVMLTVFPPMGARSVLISRFVGQDEGFFHLISEHCDGGDVSELVEKMGPKNWRLCLVIITPNEK